MKIGNIERLCLKVFVYCAPSSPSKEAQPAGQAYCLFLGVFLPLSSLVLGADIFNCVMTDCRDTLQRW